MSLYAKITVNIPGVFESFDYQIPDSLKDKTLPGCLVIVPFGKQKVQGIVIELTREVQVAETKEICQIVDPLPVVNHYQIELAHWIAESTFSPLSACLRLMLPPGLQKLSGTLYTLKTAINELNEEFSPLQKRILLLLDRRGDLRGRQLDAAFPRKHWKLAVRSLVRRGCIATRAVLPAPTVNRKKIRTAQIAQPPQIILERMGTVGRHGTQALKRRELILQFLLKEPLPVNVSWVYAATGANLSDLRELEKRELVILRETEIWRDPLAHIEVVLTQPPELTQQQDKAWQEIKAIMQKGKKRDFQKPILIHGVTSSGKTELYLRAVNEILSRGKQAIVLVPEISLTPQTVTRFLARFPGQVGLVHSRLSAGERYDTWRRARLGKLGVVVGPRSALFTPLPNLGLIVVDEFHDSSFYQSDKRPYYHAVKAAIAYGKFTNSTVILGSATPDIAIYYLAQQYGWKIIKMPSRILAHREYLRKKERYLTKANIKIRKEGKTAASLPMPLVQIVDMRFELRRGNRSIFSHALQEGLEEVLSKEQQAILFLNRRGSATYVFCRTCGYTLKCPHCEIPFTFHASSSKLICHTCGYQRNLPQQCPRCGSEQIRQYGTGTQRVEKLVQEMLPKARILRWDADTVHGKGTQEILLSHFINHRADILIGTQMLAKGLDLPLVTLVGVVLADVGLNFPDYYAAERTFQLLTQVAGRAGRSPLGGRVIFQTYQPEHYAIQKAARHDFLGFYEQELAYRKALNYPPFSRLVRLEFRHLNYARAQQEAEELAQEIKDKIKESKTRDIQMVGPAPAFFAKVRGYYRWQIILKGQAPIKLLKELHLEGWRIEVDPTALL